MLKSRGKIHNIDAGDSGAAIPIVISVAILVATLVVGGGTGWVIAFSTSPATSTTEEQEVKSGEELAEGEVPKSAGLKDTETFRDKAEGTLYIGGFVDEESGFREGTHRLERPGGESQTVYLTSTTVDLGMYDGKEVSVLGKTNRPQRVGWLMDVGYIELIE